MGLNPAHKLVEFQIIPQNALEPAANQVTV
jgi:hypothetical protein